MNFISNLYKLHYITQFTSISIINIDNKIIQIGGKSIAIYSCIPTFPREKNPKEINKKTLCYEEHKLFCQMSAAWIQKPGDGVASP